MAARSLNRRSLFASVAGIFAIGLTLRGIAAAAVVDDKIDLAKVPAKVKQVAIKALPKAKWTGASTWKEGGQVIYELEGEDAEENHVWIDVTANEKIQEVGSEVDLDKIPQGVKAALKAKMSRFVVETGYEARLDGKVIRYDFEGRRPADKKDITVSVSPDGKKIEIDEG